MISQDMIESLSKQVFAVDYILNGPFPCYSPIVKTFRNKKRPWKFNDKFEYRMLLSGTNTGGSLNSQVFKENVSLVKPGQMEVGTFRATYGTVEDGFEVDMMQQLETEEKQAAFNTDFAMNMHSLRMNVAALFKNFAIHGQYGVLHQLSAAYQDGEVWRGGSAPQYNDNQVHAITTGAGTGIYFCPNTFTIGAGAGAIPIADMTGADKRVPFRIKAPINVYNSNFKAGKYVIKTKENAPWGTADVSEMYLILENQPGYLTLLSVGTSASDWKDGEFIEIAGNREVAANSDIFRNGWTGSFEVDYGPYAGKYDKFVPNFETVYTNGKNAIVGAMEGLADLLPWYTDPNTIASNLETRLGLDMPFRDQPNRQRYSTEQAGGFVLQQQNEHIIDAILRGAFLTKSTVPYSDVGIWMNPVTRIEMGYEEGENVKVIRDNFLEGAIVYQRGVKSTSYQIGNNTIEEVIDDLNMPTDVIIIGPKNDMSYNCWDNATFELDSYIQDTWTNQKPPAVKEISLPKDFVAKLDLSQRITYGSPTLRDGRTASFTNGSNIRHPQNRMPIAMHEMGALFTEYPYCYTVVKLRKPIFDITTV